MKELISYSQRTVRATDPEVYDMMMNEALSTLKDIDNIIDLSTPEQFCSIIRYSEKTKVPADVREEFYLMGVRHKCGECSLFVPAKDGRVRWTKCEHADIGSINKDLDCCTYFYQMLKDGTNLLKGANDEEV